MGQLCGLFGLTRQAWYAATRRQEKKCFQEDLVLSEVRRLRRHIPGLGTAKLHEMMQGFLKGHRIKLGRDKLHNLLKEKGLLVKRIGTRIRTTDSDHCYRKYPNRVKNLIPGRPNELWVSDITARAAPLLPIRFPFCFPDCGCGRLLAESCRLVVAENAGSERFITGPGYGSGSARKMREIARPPPHGRPRLIEACSIAPGYTSIAFAMRKSASA